MRCCRAVDAPLPPEVAPPGNAPPQPAHRARKSALGFYLLLFLLLLPGTLAQQRSAWAGLVWTELFVFLLPPLVLVAGSNLRALPFLRLRPAPPRLLVLGAVAGAAGTLLAAALQVTLQRVLPERWFQTFDLTHLFLGPGWKRYAMAVAATLLAPVCEEVAFRGYLLRALGARLRPWGAILAVAVLFGAVHLDPVRFIGLVALGALWGWLALRAGSIWPAIAAHAANNAVAAWSLVGEGPPDGAAEALPPFAVVAAVTSSLGIAVLAPTLVAYRRATAAPPPDDDAHAPRDPADPTAHFRWARVPAPLVAALAAGVLGLAAIALLPE
jgi:membrane protease YdiL (CAAX protease family)